MKILWWSDAFWPCIGGIEVLGAKLLEWLAGRGFEAVVVTSHQGLGLPDKEIRNGIRICRFPFHEALRSRRPDLQAAAIRDVRRLKRDFHPDIVHVNFPSPGSLYHLLTRDVCKAPALAAVRSALPAGHLGPETLVGKMLRVSSWITANSRSMLEQVRTAVPEINEKSSVVYNGLETPDVEPVPMCFERPVIACVARLVEKKGIDVALRAFAMLRKRIPEASLVIAGDGPERGPLESLTLELGLAEAVTFLGWMDPARIPDLMNQACVVVVPSRRLEPFGNVAVEAMQMARPVIATDQGGLPEVVKNGETGFVVRAEDSVALAEAAVRLLENPSLARRLGQAGRERAQRRFSLDRYAREYEVLYRQIVDREKRADAPC